MTFQLRTLGWRAALGGAMALAILTPAPTSLADVDHGTTTRENVNSRGDVSNVRGDWPAMSADGRHVTFTSAATNLVPHDLNGVVHDVFVRDRVRGTTVVGSKGVDGRQCDCQSALSALGAGGRYLAFANLDCHFTDPCFGQRGGSLIPSDNNDLPDVFLRDLDTGEIDIVSVSSKQEPKRSCGTGRGRFQYISCWSVPSITPDGRYVAWSDASQDLVPEYGDTSWNVYLRDRWRGTTELVNLSSQGEYLGGEGISTDSTQRVSSDGRYVVFVSDRRLTQDDPPGRNVFVRDRERKTTYLVDPGAEGGSSSGSVAISADGRHVAFISEASDLVPKDTNGREDVFVRDLRGQWIERVSLDSRGGQADRCPPAGTCAYGVAISADGRVVAFTSEFSDLVPDDTNNWEDTFLHDRRTGATVRVSVNSSGAQGTSDFAEIAGYPPAISADGTSVAFFSDLGHLAPPMWWEGSSSIFMHQMVPAPGHAQ